MIEEKLYVSPEKLAYVYQLLKTQIKEDIGNIETALDAIIEMQNALIGGDAQ